VGVRLATLRLALFLTIAMRGHSQQQERYVKGPSCLAEFCFDEHLMSERDFGARYGRLTEPGRDGPRTCFAVPEQRLFVHFGATHELPSQIDQVFVSDVQNCRKPLISKTKFRRFLTREGIKLGDPEAKIIEAYGQPSRIDHGDGCEKLGLTVQQAANSAPFGDKVLAYVASQDTLLYAEFYIRAGKLAAILVSSSE
jgi:hypothetical protein